MSLSRSTAHTIHRSRRWRRWLAGTGVLLLLGGSIASALNYALYRRLPFTTNRGIADAT